MSHPNQPSRPLKWVMFILIPLCALALISWGVRSPTLKEFYKNLVEDPTPAFTESFNRPTISGLVDTLVMKAEVFEKNGEIQKSIDTLRRAFYLRNNLIRIQDKMNALYETKKEREKEYYEQLPLLPRDQGCNGARMGLIKKIYKMDPDSISTTLRKELNDCTSK